jgi:hypothetical protein
LLGNNEGLINKCISTKNISGSKFIGGLAGRSATGNIARSRNNGNITGTGDYVGGIVRIYCRACRRKCLHNS